MERLKQRAETHCEGHVGARRRVKEKGGGREREHKRLKKKRGSWGREGWVAEEPERNHGRWRN